VSVVYFTDADSELHAWDLDFYEDEDGDFYAYGPDDELYAIAPGVGGGEVLIDSQGQTLDLIDPETIAQAKQEIADDEEAEALAEEIDFNAKLGAIEWTADVRHQIEQIERRLNRELTSKEVKTLIDDSMQSQGPPDLQASYDALIGFRDVNRDANERRKLIEEVAQDSMDEAAEREAEEAEDAEDEPEPFDAEEMRDPAKRREAVEGIAQAHIDAPEDEPA
jgi:hypothetical protein